MQNTYWKVSTSGSTVNITLYDFFNVQAYTMTLNAFYFLQYFKI